MAQGKARAYRALHLPDIPGPSPIAVVDVPFAQGKRRNADSTVSRPVPRFIPSPPVADDRDNQSLFLCRFRILIIGRANAGKTTILQTVCKTQENPEIYNSAGDKIKVGLMPSSERGLHDIDNEMVFRSNPRYVFHDSRGFEAGGHSEFDQVRGKR
ncbi:hypothetical protein F4604DRAFT_1726037 [Suillus subluteus]|nr:hypothetical protein F4604DRAFT_1726037 [Suillus subluteus]